MKKRIVTLGLCAALTAVAITAGTLAYFTDTKTVENTFSFSEGVHITLDEALVGDDGKAVDPAQRVTENAYENIYPGQKLDKDPTVHVDANSDKCYVRAFVTINNKAALDEIFDPGIDLSKVLTGTSENWDYKGCTVVGDARVYELQYKDELAAKESSDPVFKNVVIPTSLTGDQIKTIEDLEIDVVAQAVQSAEFANYEAAWAAIDAK